MNKGEVYTHFKKMQKSLEYNIKVFSVNQILRKRSKTLFPEPNPKLFSEPE